MNWISVKDRKPGKDDPVQDYLVVMEFQDGSREVDIRHLSEVTQSMYDWHSPVFEKPPRWRRVTHWMELPELPPNLFRPRASPMNGGNAK